MGVAEGHWRCGLGDKSVVARKDLGTTDIDVINLRENSWKEVKRKDLPETFGFHFV